MSERILFSRLLEGLISGPCILRMLGKGIHLKTIALLVFNLWLVKVKLKNVQHHYEKLKCDVGVTCLVFSLEGILNVVFFPRNT